MWVDGLFTIWIVRMDLVHLHETFKVGKQRMMTYRILKLFHDAWWRNNVPSKENIGFCYDIHNLRILSAYSSSQKLFRHVYVYNQNQIK